MGQKGDQLKEIPRRSVFLGLRISEQTFLDLLYDMEGSRPKWPACSCRIGRRTLEYFKMDNVFILQYKVSNVISRNVAGDS